MLCEGFIYPSYSKANEFFGDKFLVDFASNYFNGENLVKKKEFFQFKLCFYQQK
jgi:hypothetical protein